MNVQTTPKCHMQHKTRPLLRCLRMPAAATWPPPPPTTTPTHHPITPSSPASSAAPVALACNATEECQRMPGDKACTVPRRHCLQERQRVSELASKTSTHRSSATTTLFLDATLACLLSSIASRGRTTIPSSWPGRKKHAEKIPEARPPGSRHPPRRHAKPPHQPCHPQKKQRWMRVPAHA